MGDTTKDLEAGTVPPVYQNKIMDKQGIKSIRAQLGFTQTQLARYLDLSVKTIQTYEQGKSVPSGLVTKVLRHIITSKSFKRAFDSIEI